MEMVALIGAWVVVIVIGFFGAVIAIRMFSGKIDTSGMLDDGQGKASFSRFQFLIFTFVIAMCLLVLTLESGEFPKIDLNVLGLLGISGASFVASKGIDQSSTTQSSSAQTTVTQKTNLP